MEWTTPLPPTKIYSGGENTDSELLLLSRFSRVQLCATPETAPHRAPPSLGFSRQEYWSGLPFPSPRLRTMRMTCYLLAKWNEIKQGCLMRTYFILCFRYHLSESKMYFSALLRCNVHTIKFTSQLHSLMRPVKCVIQCFNPPEKFLQTPLQTVPAPWPLAAICLPSINTILP